MSRFFVSLVLFTCLLAPCQAEAKSPKRKQNPQIVVVSVDAYREVVAWYRDEFAHRTSVQWLIEFEYTKCTQVPAERLRFVKPECEKAIQQSEDCLRQQAREQREGIEPEPRECCKEVTRRTELEGQLHALQEDLSLCVKMTTSPVDTQTSAWNVCAEKQFEVFADRAKEFQTQIDQMTVADKDDQIDLFRSIRNYLLNQVAQACGEIPKLGVMDRGIGANRYHPTELEYAVALSQVLTAEIQITPFAFGLDVTPIHWWTFEAPERPLLHRCMMQREILEGVPILRGCPNYILEQLYHSPKVTPSPNRA
ncbi:MAG: hypothetical protein NTX72_04630 [Candidatus Uhrbacteria bacterium]|nr:hypothetical protein [Candidatus Uhrbacteria bacterium]